MNRFLLISFSTLLIFGGKNLFIQKYLSIEWTFILKISYLPVIFCAFISEIHVDIFLITLQFLSEKYDKTNQIVLNLRISRAQIISYFISVFLRVVWTMVVPSKQYQREVIKQKLDYAIITILTCILSCH